MTTFGPAVAPACRILADSGLTLRELEAIDAAADGLREDEIAERLNISVRTIHTMMGRIHTKLGVTSRGSRAGAVAHAYRVGLLLPVPACPPPLPVHQRAVLGPMAWGLENREIGDRLGISASTVKTHLVACARALDARNRAHLVRRSVDAGLLVLSARGGGS